MLDEDEHYVCAVTLWSSNVMIMRRQAGALQLRIDQSAAIAIHPSRALG